MERRLRLAWDAVMIMNDEVLGMDISSVNLSL